MAESAQQQGAGVDELPPRAERRTTWPAYEVLADIDHNGEHLEFLRLDCGWHWKPDPDMRLRCPRCREFITGDFTKVQACPCGRLAYDPWGEFHRESTAGIEFWRVVPQPEGSIG
jgi:hypothetical protein